MKVGVRVGRVLDQYLGLRLFRDLVVVGLWPPIVCVEQSRRRRDNLSHIELHLREPALFIQFGIERFSIRQGQDRLAACLPANWK